MSAQKGESVRKSLIREKAEEDPSYRPYCMRCSSIIRMSRIEPFFWRCACGAAHDERTNAEKFGVTS